MNREQKLYDDYGKPSWYEEIVRYLTVNGYWFGIGLIAAIALTFYFLNYT